MKRLFGPMEQMGFVVDNFEEPIKHWTEKLNVGPFFILEHLDLKDVYYYGKNGEENKIDFSVALAYSGDMQIEFIKQHCDTPSIYNEYVSNKKKETCKQQKYEKMNCLFFCICFCVCRFFAIREIAGE